MNISNNSKNETQSHYKSFMRVEKQEKRIMWTSKNKKSLVCWWRSFGKKTIRLKIRFRSKFPQSFEKEAFMLIDCALIRFFKHLIIKHLKLIYSGWASFLFFDCFRFSSIVCIIENQWFANYVLRDTTVCRESFSDAPRDCI